MARKPWHHATESNTARGYGAQWRKDRKVIIARDKGLCQPCLHQGRVTPYAAVDHIVPKTKGGTEEHSNLQCICGPCHDAKTQIEAAEAQGRRLKVQIGLDGWPVA